MPTSSQQPRRSWMAFALIGLALPLAGAVAAWNIYRSALHPPPESPAEAGLERLRTFMPGEALAVPSEPGVWHDARASAHLVLARATPSDEPVDIELCRQRAYASKATNRIYPVRVRARWEDIIPPSGTNQVRRSPVVLPELARRGFPGLDIAGVADALATGTPLRLTPSGGGNDWVLLSDIPDLPGEHWRELGREAWLLWRGDAKAGAEGESRTRYDHGLRVRRVSASTCEAGALRLELYSASQSEVTQERTLVAAFPVLGGAWDIRLPPGRYRVADRPPEPMEDRALFERALAAGLIRLNKAGDIEVAPVDLFTARLAGQAPESWHQVRLNDDNRRLLRRLYAKADGRFVRERIRQYNAQRRWLAIRIREKDKAIMPTRIHAWRASSGGQTLPLQEGLPDAATRMFDVPPLGWGPWLRLGDGDGMTRDGDTVVFTHVPAQGAQSLEMLVLGEFLGVEGAEATRVEDVCRGPDCATPATLRRVQIDGLQPVRAVKLHLGLNRQPMPWTRNAGMPNPIRMEQGHLVWAAPFHANDHLAQPARVTIQDRNGVPLFTDSGLSPEARAANLAPIIGLDAKDGTGIAAMLARLGQRGRQAVRARLGIDLGMQRLAQEVVECVGQAGHAWDMSRQTCGAAPLYAHLDTAEQAGRRAGLLVMDAGTGEILAAAGSPRVPENADAQEWQAFDRYNPSASPLRPWGWQHEGGLEVAPGSIFKLVTALGLEKAASASPELDRLLDGQGVEAIHGVVLGKKSGFNMNSACYPAPCGKTRISNHKGHRPDHYLRDGAFGVREALSASINTWFAWLAETNDATLVGRGQPDARPLSSHALDAQRPVSAMAHVLGFESALNLDGGFLPSSYSWREGDVLRATPSRFDPILDQHNVRQQAVGLRQQATPLQLARVAASIGEGRVVMPRLLSDLDGQTTKQSGAVPLNVRLDRVRAGMKDVVSKGTAAFVFNTPDLKSLSRGVFAKTGTAPVPHLGLNTAWFVGYLEPGTLPGVSRRLAFAAWVTRTKETGGTHAAPILAAWLRAMATRESLASPALSPSHVSTGLSG